ncbi:aspartate racemase [Siminovitchia terrae]|uniref:aspartate/glutamate racemase family protein n=1 Tax=Siminovitchia terrae TaxID=1914933 RepID=UPI001B061A0F|nr:amino acid racemase [Siminovitchia terrae]GIN90209.1 aspartate racemase [Siminovitchia terrae]
MCRTIGILGGMGPYATVDLFQKIVMNTPAQVDQDHLKILIYNNPKIPPRVLGVNRPSNSPKSELINSALLLQQAGADFIIMPCHTAHIWFNDVKNEISIPFYSMVENTVQAVSLEYKNLENKKIVLLATETTVNSELYQKAFDNTPFQIIVPNLREQKIIDHAIKNVKGGKKNKQSLGRVNEIINAYHQKGVSKLLGCCTEIPLMFPYFNTESEMIDPTLLLAKMAIKKVK